MHTHSHLSMRRLDEGEQHRPCSWLMALSNRVCHPIYMESYLAKKRCQNCCMRQAHTAA